MFRGLFSTGLRAGVLAFALLSPALAATAPREGIALDGAWQFRIDPGNAGDAGHWYRGATPFPQTIQVPGAWQAQGVGKPEGILRHDYAGAAWYRRAVAVPENWRGRIVRLRIGGVHRSVRAYVNGVATGTHDGFNAPFALDVTGVIRPGASNQIVLRVENPPSPITTSPDKQPPLMPTGMLNYIGNWGGFYGDISLESAPRAWIDSTYITSDVANGRISVHVHVASEGAAAGPAMVRIAARGHQAEAPVEIPASGAADATVELPLPDAPLWSPEHPS
jgi:beta-glucuronidase